MTDKQTGARAAAERIFCQEVGVSHKELIGLRQLSDRPDIRIQEIEAVIVNHCPQDKAGKLVEALTDCKHIMNISANQLSTAGCSSGLAFTELVECVIRTRIALADYEANK